MLLVSFANNIQVKTDWGVVAIETQTITSISKDNHLFAHLFAKITSKTHVGREDRFMTTTKKTSAAYTRASKTRNKQKMKFAPK